MKYVIVLLFIVEATSDGESEIEGVYADDGSGEIPSSTEQTPGEHNQLN